MPLGIFVSSCAINIRWFPFDEQRCRLKFGSWTYDGTQLNLWAGSNKTIESNIYQPSGEWDLVGKLTFNSYSAVSFGVLELCRRRPTDAVT